ncbi:hypothetical protein BDF14DRAFT_156687 [Spinellus fusiger]|nr:hypothetical protein BDF14DRAFT_156687 [Spinellus fusiger]
MCIVTNGCNSFSLTVQDIPKRRNRGHYCLSSISMGRLSAVALVQPSEIKSQISVMMSLMPHAYLLFIVYCLLFIVFYYSSFFYRVMCQYFTCASILHVFNGYMLAGEFVLLTLASCELLV